MVEGTDGFEGAEERLGTEVGGQQMVQMVDLWDVYLKLEGRASTYLFNFCLYVVFWLLLMGVVYRMPR